MSNKGTPKFKMIHLRAYADGKPHKEFYEPKLELMVCGCGNRRELNKKEKIQHGLMIQSTTFEYKVIKVGEIPEVKTR